jgi:hypothetical protein
MKKIIRQTKGLSTGVAPGDRLIPDPLIIRSSDGEECFAHTMPSLSRSEGGTRKAKKK